MSHKETVEHPIDRENDGDLENYADIDSWIAIGGGNHTSVDELLELGYNQQQIDYLCTLSPTWVVGMVLERASTPFHYDCHPKDHEDFKHEYLTKFLLLGEQTQ